MGLGKGVRGRGVCMECELRMLTSYAQYGASQTKLYRFHVIVIIMKIWGKRMSARLESGNLLYVSLST